MKKKFWIALIIFSLVGQIAWVVENMYFNVFIYKMFNASAMDISLMVALSAVAATLTTIFMGALSDKLGKRKIFISLGYIIWGVSILSFAFIRKGLISSIFGEAVNALSVGVSLVIIMDCVMTFFGSTANDACFNAWLTDNTDSSNRGIAEGLNSMMPLIAILCVFGGFMGFNLDLESSWVVIYIVIGSVVSIIGIIGFFIIDDSKTSKANDLGYFQTILYGFRPSVIKKEARLYWSLLFFTIFGIAIQIFMPYLIIYYEKSLEMTDYVLIMAPAIILASVVTFFYGKIYDKIGYEKSSIPALLILLLGFIILFLFPGVIHIEGFFMKAIVFIGSLLMMSGYLSGMAVFGARIRDCTPLNMAGRFQGLRIVGQVLIPGVIGPMIGARVLKNAEVILNNDGTTSFLPNKNIFLASLICVVLLIIGMFVFFKITNKKENIA